MKKLNNKNMFIYRKLIQKMKVIYRNYLTIS